MKKFLVLLLMMLVLLFCTQALNYYAQIENGKQVRNTEEDKNIQIDALKTTEEELLVQLEKRRSMVACYDTLISSKTELILLTEQGTIDLMHDKTPENRWWQDWLIDSYVNISSDYQMIISIPTDAIYISSNDEGHLKLQYDESRIVIKSIELSNTVTDSWTALFGKLYTPEEIVALINIAKQNVYNSAVNDVTLHEKAKQNLENTLRKFAYEMGFICEEVIIHEIREMTE